MQLETESPTECRTAPKWNLYAHRLMDYGERFFATTEKPNGRFDKLIMPSADGIMRDAPPSGWNWYAIRWPTNPHNTGERAILEMLNGIAQEHPEV